MKLFSAYYASGDPFGIFSSVQTVSRPEELSKDGALILWGGEDISPEIYHQMPRYARAGSVMSTRDRIEVALCNQAMFLGIPIIGICRGAQLLCCLSGGSLFQHIEGKHHSPHMVDTYDGLTLKTSSCHHQALDLKPLNPHDYSVLAWDSQGEIRAFREWSDSMENIPEVVKFNNTRGFAIQGHPEWMNVTDPFVKWCVKELKEML